MIFLFGIIAGCTGSTVQNTGQNCIRGFAEQLSGSSMLTSDYFFFYYHSLLMCANSTEWFIQQLFVCDFELRDLCEA